MSYREQAARIAQAYGLDPEIFVRQIEQESAFDPMAVSPAGAGGIAQIMPGTAAAPGFGIAPISNQDRFNVPVALDFGAQYMRAMLDRYDGDYPRALAAYNAGFGRVDDAGGVPNIPEAQNYVSRILGDGVSLGAGDRRLEGSMGGDMLGTDQERPRGILEALGIQRRDPNAEGETGMPFFQRGSFKDFMGNLAMAFNELRDEPSQAIPAVVTRNQERRQEQATANRTADWLESQGMTDLANALRQGAINASDAVSQAQARSQPRQPIEINGRLIDPVTYEVLYEGGPDNDAIRQARTEFTGLPAVRDFADVSSAYARVVASAEDPSPAGDLALIFNYMKILDPNSSVQQGEFANAQNAGSVDDRTRSLYNRILEGTRLSDDQRGDFLDRAGRLYGGAENQYRSIAEQYSDFARAAGLPVEQVIPDFSYFAGVQESPPQEARIPEAPVAPEGYTQQEWEQAWQNMTPQQRALFNTEDQ